jgi:hypothetical protein
MEHMRATFTLPDGIYKGLRPRWFSINNYTCLFYIPLQYIPNSPHSNKYSSFITLPNKDMYIISNQNDKIIHQKFLQNIKIDIQTSYFSENND